ncbi:MAG TPA: hypothetical protein ENN45_04440, partial [Bacteroidetes bacterium]|nr:hypothetical protein [Bacteroidota bacterium]
MNKLLLWIIVFALISVNAIASYPICGDYIYEPCMVMSPGDIVCDVYEYWIFTTSGELIEHGNMTHLFNQTYYFNFTWTNHTADYILSICDGSTAIVHVLSDLPEITNSTSFIFVGGVVEIINDTYPANFSFYFPDYPYVQINTTARMDFHYRYNETDMKDANVVFNLSGVNVTLAYNFVYNSYPIWLYFNNTEIGDHYWEAYADRFGYSNSNLSGTLIVRDYVKVKVKLYESCKFWEFWCGWFNPHENMKNYKNRFGYVFASPVPEESLESANFSWARQLEPLANLAIWGDRLFNKTNLYRLPNKAFSAEYNKGEATLFLPAGETYMLEFMAGKMAWENPTGYGYGYYSKKYTEKVYLDAIQPYSGLDYYHEYFISNYDLHKSNIWLFWIIFGLIIIAGLVIISFMFAFSPLHG